MHGRFKTVLIVAALVVIGILSYYAYAQQRTISELKATLTSQQTANGLALQQQCAQRAEFFFKSGGYRGAAGGVSSYEDHYNAKLNKCFILIETLLSGSGQDDSLYDAFEGRQYANYFATNLLGTGVCTIEDSSPSECSSIDFRNRIDAAYLKD